MPRLLEEKVAIVAGGSRDLGLAIAMALGTDGAKVLVVSRHDVRVREAAAKVRECGTEAESFVTDVTAPSAAQGVVDAALKRFGRVDILVNNAGFFVWKPILDLLAEDWERTLATNLSAPFFLLQAAARVMAEQENGGSIVNVASVHSSMPDPNVVAQCASKYGLVGLTEAAAEALRDYNVRVNAVAPGSIEPGSALRRGEGPARKVTQADVASLVVYLASHLAASITGAVINVFGSTSRTIRN
jgi:NAD(P)-dependent dehydrogenase (short-subunit alcohol dehydrogenase family)